MIVEEILMLSGGLFWLVGGWFILEMISCRINTGKWPTKFYCE